jgi:hypothetical protein
MPGEERQLAEKPEHIKESSAFPASGSLTGENG